MRFNVFKNTVFPIIIGIVLVMISCGNKSQSDARSSKIKVEQQDDSLKRLQDSTDIMVGANRIELYLPLIKGKRIGIVANQASVVFFDKKLKSKNKSYTHLVDSLVSLHVDVQTVFAPEHGFRGKADAGEVIKDGVDPKTGIPIISLYSANKKPKLEQIKETEKYESDVSKGVSKIDAMVFDLQDVGVRFYTYISTLHYVMEACAEANISLIILDRPNPNGHYIDGPILEMENKSFVGMHPIPVAYGMTIGEYAKMINGEKWLANGIQCDLKVIPIKNYNHKLSYSLPIKPSPNLPNDQAINLYPSLCFFEGTNVSAGRGTETQFQIFGSPFLNKDTFDFEFIPKPNEGSKYPKHQNTLCYGMDLTKIERIDTLNLEWLIDAYNNTKNKSEFFNSFFIKLSGTKKLQQQIEAGMSEEDIKSSWKTGLEAFEKTRETYLLYP
ncbi:exo-beta-N-acetylmuramidase NamZ family protein [Algibacter sp.]|uniref:exo-beta-N-acetylmuramidase NamZ family protein n=1 Tax=Algibacter sp. TaxID=1872428 RepID=UPI003C7885E9